MSVISMFSAAAQRDRKWIVPLPVPSIWLNGSPVNRILDEGEPVVLWQAPLGRVYSYRWQYRISPLGAWTNCSIAAQGAGTEGITEPVLRIPDVTNMNGHEFRCSASVPGSSGVSYSQITTLSVGSGQHQEFHINPTSGDDASLTGSEIDPWRSLSKATSAIAAGTVQPGDTIVLESGVYSGVNQTLYIEDGQDGTAAEPIRWTNTGTVTIRGDSNSSGYLPVDPSCAVYVAGQHHHFDFNSDLTINPLSDSMGAWANKTADYNNGIVPSTLPQDLVMRGFNIVRSRTWCMQTHGYWQGLCFANLNISGGGDGEGPSDTTNECIYLGRAPDMVTYTDGTLDKPRDILIWNCDLDATHETPANTNSNAVDAKCGAHRIVIDGCTMNAYHETVSGEGSWITIRNNTITSNTNAIRLGTYQSTIARVGLIDPDLDGGGAHCDIFDNAINANTALVLDWTFDTNDTDPTYFGMDVNSVGFAAGNTGLWVTVVNGYNAGSHVTDLDPSELAVYESGFGNSYVGDLIPYLVGDYDPDSGDIATLPTHPASQWKYHEVSLGPGVFSVGPVGAIPSLGGSTSHADYGVSHVIDTVNADSTSSGKSVHHVDATRSNYWLVIKGVKGQTVVDLSLTNSRLQFAAAGISGDPSTFHRLLFVDVDFIGGSVGNEGVGGLTQVNFWNCLFEYTPKQWAKNLRASAIAQGHGLKLAEPPIYKDPTPIGAESIGGLYNYGAYYHLSTCIDAAAVATATGGMQVNDTVDLSAVSDSLPVWMNTAGDNSTWLSIIGKMGSAVPTPVRVSGSTSPSGLFGFYGCDMHGIDDAVHIGASQYTSLRGCRFFLVDQTHIGEFFLTADDEYVSADPGAVYGNEVDWWQNDSTQIGSSGFRSTHDYCDIVFGRMAFDHEPSSTRTSWESYFDNITVIPFPLVSGDGIGQSSIFSAEYVDGAPVPWPGSLTKAVKTGPALLLGNTDDLTSSPTDQSTKMVATMTNWRVLRHASQTGAICEINSGGSVAHPSFYLNWSRVKLNNVPAQASVVQYNDDVDSSFIAQFETSDLGITSPTTWMDPSAVLGAAISQSKSHAQEWRDAYTEGWLTGPSEVCGASTDYVNGTIAIPGTPSVYNFWVGASPSSRVLDEGEPVILWQSPSGRVFSQKWQYRTSVSGTWVDCAATAQAQGTDVEGLTTPVMRINDVTGMDGWQYRSAVKISGQTIYSATTTLTVRTGQHTTHYVDPSNGNDSTGVGTSIAPWKTLNKVTSLIGTTIRPGHTIVLKAGTYAGTGQSLHINDSESGTAAEPIRWTNEGAVVNIDGDTNSNSYPSWPSSMLALSVLVQGSHHVFDFDSNVTISSPSTSHRAFGIKSDDYFDGIVPVVRPSDILMRGFRIDRSSDWSLQVWGYWERLCFADLTIDGGGKTGSTNECIYLGRSPGDASFPYNDGVFDKPRDILIYGCTLDASGNSSGSVSNSNAVDIKRGAHRVIIDNCIGDSRHDTFSCEGSWITVRNSTIDGSSTGVRVGSQTGIPFIGLTDPDLDGHGAHVDIYDNVFGLGGSVPYAILLDSSLDPDNNDGIDQANVGGSGGNTGSWVTGVGSRTGTHSAAQLAVYGDYFDVIWTSPYVAQNTIAKPGTKGRLHRADGSPVLPMIGGNVNMPRSNGTLDPYTGPYWSPTTAPLTETQMEHIFKIGKTGGWHQFASSNGHTPFIRANMAMLGHGDDATGIGAFPVVDVFDGVTDTQWLDQLIALANTEPNGFVIMDNHTEPGNVPTDEEVTQWAAALASAMTYIQSQGVTNIIPSTMNEPASKVGFSGTGFTSGVVNPGDTTATSSQAVYLPTIQPGDPVLYSVISSNGGYEIVGITEHAEGSTSFTMTRGLFGTGARTHTSSVWWHCHAWMTWHSGDWTTSAWAQWNLPIITAIRATGWDGPIIVPEAGGSGSGHSIWGAWDEEAMAGNSIVTSFGSELAAHDDNIIVDVHVYADWALGAKGAKDISEGISDYNGQIGPYIDYARSLGLDVVIGECGYNEKVVDGVETGGNQGDLLYPNFILCRINFWEIFGTSRETGGGGTAGVHYLPKQTNPPPATATPGGQPVKCGPYSGLPDAHITVWQLESGGYGFVEGSSSALTIITKYYGPGRGLYERLGGTA